LPAVESSRWALAWRISAAANLSPRFCALDCFAIRDCFADCADISRSRRRTVRGRNGNAPSNSSRSTLAAAAILRSIAPICVAAPCVDAVRNHRCAAEPPTLKGRKRFGASAETVHWPLLIWRQCSCSVEPHRSWPNGRSSQLALALTGWCRPNDGTPPAALSSLDLFASLSTGTAPPSAASGR